MTRTVALIDYGSGNLRSAEKALVRAGKEHETDDTVVVTSDPDIIRKADRIVLPGVGAFADCMRGLSATPGVAEALREAVRQRARPFLGICVGMQLMAQVGREFGDTEGLGWIEGEVVRMTPQDSSLKIPHMGWNELAMTRRHPILEGIAERAHAYFVHSFEFKAVHDVMASTNYGGPITAAVGRDNLFGTQFHPEKSQAVGLRLLANFLRWRP